MKARLYFGNARFWLVLGLTAVLAPLMFAAAVNHANAADEPLRIIVFGAHPDDCEINVSGCAAMWAEKGHKVKFVSVTNGDIGHSVIAGGPLMLRRVAEAEKAAEILGIETEVLDIHDGEVMPTLENRRTIIRLIRDWNADVVITNRPNDYHPDHRYTSILVQDAAYMVTVPFICPDYPPLQKNPVFLYWRDRFEKPNPFEAEIVVGIDDVYEQKIRALTAMESQFLEYGANGPGDPEKFFQGTDEEKLAYIKRRFENRLSVRDEWKPVLRQYYGDAADGIQYAEAFEVCEYGAQPSREEIGRLFPFFP